MRLAVSEPLSEEVFGEDSCNKLLCVVVARESRASDASFRVQRCVFASAALRADAHLDGGRGSSLRLRATRLHA